MSHCPKCGCVMVEGTDKVSTRGERENLIWKSSDGKESPITELEDRHLINILNFMYRRLKRNVRDSVSDEMLLRALRNRDRVFYHLEAEVEFRGLFWRKGIEGSLEKTQKENENNFSFEEESLLSSKRIIEV